MVFEGIGSYGAKLARAAADAGYVVGEPSGPCRPCWRGTGKSDEVDAELIARSVLGVETTMLRPRRDEGVRAAVRVLVVTRDSINAEGTPALW